LIFFKAAYFNAKIFFVKHIFHLNYYFFTKKPISQKIGRAARL